MILIPDLNEFFVEDQQKHKTGTEQRFCLAPLKAQEVDYGAEWFFFSLN